MLSRKSFSRRRFLKRANGVTLTSPEHRHAIQAIHAAAVVKMGSRPGANHRRPGGKPDVGHTETRTLDFMTVSFSWTARIGPSGPCVAYVSA